MKVENSKDQGIVLQATSVSKEFGATSIEKSETVETRQSSAASLRLKKSSNILTSLIKRTKKKKTKNSDISIKSIHVSSQNLSSIPSNYSINIPIEENNEIELHVENYEHKYRRTDNPSKVDDTQSVTESAVNTSTSNQSIGYPKKKNNFFKKFLKKQNSTDELTHQKSAVHLTTQTNPKVENIDGSNTCLLLEESCSFEVPTTYIKFGQPTLNVTLASALQAVQEMDINLKESESHLMQILHKYIRDQSLQKDLVNSLSQHTKLQWEAEKRVSALSNDLWMQQMEIGMAQEKTLQQTLNSLVNQNRKLQTDNDTMFRKYEKLLKKLRCAPGDNTRCLDSETQVDNLLRHNERLQQKMEKHMKKTETLESELYLLQRQNDCLEQQLRNSTGKIHNLKAYIQRTKTDFDLEQVSLNYKLQVKEQILKDSVEIGDILLEDLDSLKRQLKCMPFSINWSKFKGRGSCLVDLMHMCRSCINELAKELINVYTVATLRNKDLESLRDTNAKLQENLQKSCTELNNLSKKLESGKLGETEKLLLEQKIKMLEIELKSTEEKLEKIKLEHQAEKAELYQKIVECENTSKEMMEKDKLFEQTKLFINNITSENFTLRTQVQSLSKLLIETGAGDVAKELKMSQEQIMQIHSEYHQLLSEKQNLLAQVNSLREDNRLLLAHQETNYKHLQQQIKELEMVHLDNNSLKQKLETERQTVMTLQQERMKYLDEKNMLKSVFQSLKSEITRVQQLEGTVADMTKEASRLAIVAQYNKDIGDKFKSEVVQKDNTISQLRSSVEQLNHIQIQNTKEKLSLCFELTEVCQMKDKLNNILSKELRKNVELDQSNEAFAKTAQSQFKKIEEKQRNDRTALKILANNLKSTLEQKSLVEKENDKMVNEMRELKNALAISEKKQQTLSLECNDKKKRISELMVEHEKIGNMNNKLRDRLEQDTEKYNSNMKELEKLINQLRKEKTDVENSIKYLQNSIQKLQKDLDMSREKETDLMGKLRKENDENTALKDIINAKSNEIELLSDEKDKLNKESEYLNELCDKILNDFEVSLKTNEEKELLMKEEIKESSMIIHSNSVEIKQLKQDLIDKNYEMRKLIQERDSDNTKLKEVNHKLEEKLSVLLKDNEECSVRNASLAKEVNEIQNRLKLVLSEKEEDYKSYKKNVDELKKKMETVEEDDKRERCALKQEIKELTKKLQNEKSAYDTLTEIHKDISVKYMKSIKDLMEMKKSRQESLEKLNEASNISELQNQITVLTASLTGYKSRINLLTTEKEALEYSYKDLQKLHNNMANKCLSLENQITNNAMEREDIEPSDTVTNDTILNMQQQIERLKEDLEETHKENSDLRNELTKMRQQITTLEFQKSDVTLRLHEALKKLETEQQLTEQLQNTHKLILAALLKMRDEGKVDACSCTHLLDMVGSNTTVIDRNSSRNSYLALEF